MKYLILDGLPNWGKRRPFVYRGTQRKEPPYCDSQSQLHEINVLFEWYIGETYNFDGARDLRNAQRYVELCNEYFPEKHFELIGVTKDQPSENDERFLGFDIGWGTSLIFLAALPLGPRDDKPEEPIQVLENLIKRYFHPKLNEFGLFRTFQDASQCHDALRAMQSFHPDYYDCQSHERPFPIVAVYLISGSR